MVPAETVGAYIAIATAASLFTNPIWGRVKRPSQSRLFIGASIALLATPLIAILFDFYREAQRWRCHSA
jgi:hypothetical protein